MRQPRGVLTRSGQPGAAASRLQAPTKSGGEARGLQPTRAKRVPSRKAAAAQLRYRLSRSRTVHGPAPPAASQQPGPKKERATAANAATATGTPQQPPPGPLGAAAAAAWAFSSNSGCCPPAQPGAGWPPVPAAGAGLKPVLLLSVASGCMLLLVLLRTGTSPAPLSPGAALDGGLCAAPPRLAAPATAPEARGAGSHALAGGPPRERLQQTLPSPSQRPLSAASRRPALSCRAGRAQVAGPCCD